MPLSFEELVRGAPDAVVVHDMKNRVLFWNKAAERLYGWPAEEIEGRSIAGILYPDPSMRKNAYQALLDNGCWTGELRQIDREGNEQLIRVRQRLYRGRGGGEPPVVVSFNADVTQKRTRNDAQGHAHHIRSSSLLAGGIAHEFNNMLASIMLSVAMLRRSIDEPKALNMISMIEHSANRGARLVNDLLAYERGKRGGGCIIRRTDVEQVVKRLASELVPDRVSLDLEIVDDLWEFNADLGAITEVIRSVLQNACEAMPDGGDLKVRVGNRLFDENIKGLALETKAGAYVNFVISDSGHGIDGEMLPHVAEPFYTTKEPKRGHGFGLANAQTIVKGHKGFMVLDSECGRGTTMNIFFPSVDTTGKSKFSPTPFAEGTEGQGKSVLVVDDEPFVREMVKKTLESRGYSVLVAENGKEALAVYEGQMDKIDLVVTNVDMPYMDGLSLCRALKQLKPEVRILVSSGHRHPDKLQAIKDSGVTHFLGKPYTADDLAAEVQAILSYGK